MKKNFRLKIAAGALVALVLACSSTPKLGDYAPGTNAQEATTQLSREIETAQNQQMDVLAPQNFANAKKHLQKSKDIQSKDNFKNDNALAELALAKDSLSQAKAAAARAAPQLTELTEARQAALTAGAMQNQHKELVNLDDDLIDMSRKLEKGNAEVDLKEKAILQKKYLDLELAAIKSEKLANARNLLKRAKEANAHKAAPKTWASAESKFSNADAVITSDRHDQAAISSAVIMAENEARKALEVASTARNAKSRTTEDVALDIYEKKGTISDLNSELKKEISEGKSGEQAAALALSAKDRELSESERQRQSLQSEQRFNQTLQDAQKQFDAKDATVYRQGDNLVIRLKSVNFPSGKADLPAHALPVLSKTKQLITDLNPQKVIVEGHTDAIGSQEINKRISQDRAETVAKYLTADSSINASNIETRGMGDEQPLTSNKTKAGRSENRRVDIVITPNIVQ